MSKERSLDKTAGAAVIKDVALYHCSEYLINPAFSARITNNAVTACST